MWKRLIRYRSLLGSCLGLSPPQRGQRSGQLNPSVSEACRDSVSFSRTLNWNRVLTHILQMTDIFLSTLEHPAAIPDHCLMAFLHSWTSELPSQPHYSTVNVLAIHSNIEHREFDTDKSGSGLHESVASIWLVENEWNTSVKIRSPILSASTSVQTIITIHADSCG